MAVTLQKSGYHGIFLPEADVVLDGTPPRSRKSRSGDESEFHVFISHAHSDHAPRSRRIPVYATPATADLIRARGHKGPVREVPFGESICLPKARVTLYPAGHILGSAMIFVETDSGSLLYTGDCRTPPSPVTEGFALPDRVVDELIVEATFGLPLYKWAPYDELAGDIRRFVYDSLENGATPVMLCYNLGKAQEVMHILGDTDPPVQVQIHPAGAELCRVYEKHGVPLGDWEPLDIETLPGKTLITPSNTLDSRQLRDIPNLRIAYVSGWATLETRGAGMAADTLIPLSDHLDFFELLGLCRRIGPKNIHLTHSPNPDVAAWFLQQEGFRAGRLALEENRHE
ncbi:hypothetical protein QA596_09420 [Balneolales bacterium ANBcel1]|nr:hypothetical protein [Balneolales bacterium ANBcel1]